MEAPPLAAEPLTISEEVREAIQVNVGDMSLAQKHEFTLSFFRFVAIFVAEIGKVIAGNPAQDAVALLQSRGPCLMTWDHSIFGEGRACGHGPPGGSCRGRRLGAPCQGPAGYGLGGRR